jgi:hypothetical protein
MTGIVPRSAYVIAVGLTSWSVPAPPIVRSSIPVATRVNGRLFNRPEIVAIPSW